MHDFTKSYIESSFETLVKADSFKSIKKYAQSLQKNYETVRNRIKEKERLLANRSGYDYMNLNADNMLSMYSKDCGCSVAEFKAQLSAYIASQEESLWQALSMEGVPSPEELVEHILSKHFDGIAEEIRRHIAKPPLQFSTMLLHPILGRWDEEWEDKCIFQARFYDIFNFIDAESVCASKDFVTEFTRCKTAENPDKYSRYVILIKTPFSEKQVIYTIGGNFTTGYICRGRAAEWKATFYGSMDEVITSYASASPIEKKQLMRDLYDYNALYYVLSYRNEHDKDFTVQYYNANRHFYMQDAVSAIEKNIMYYKKG